MLIGGGPNVTRNGYIACQFPSSVDAPPDIGKYYPGYDWASMAKVAWTVPMVVDYLYTLTDVEKQRIAITGYSRLGKMATYAAAIDERIAACIAGSTGVGGVLSWRHGSERNIGKTGDVSRFITHQSERESIGQSTTRESPQFYAGLSRRLRRPRFSGGSKRAAFCLAKRKIPRSREWCLGIVNTSNNSIDSSEKTDFFCDLP